MVLQRGLASRSGTKRVGAQPQRFLPGGLREVDENNDWKNAVISAVVCPG